MGQGIDTLSAASADIWCRTCSKTSKVTYKWTIENFSLHCNKSPGYSMESSIFRSGGNNRFGWRLNVNPYRCDIHGIDYIIISLQCLTKNASHATAQFKLHIVDINNLNRDLLGSFPSFIRDELSVFNGEIKKSLLLKEADVLLPHDELTLLCEIVILDDTFQISGEDEPVQVETLDPRINDDYQLLFETRSLSDITLTVGGKDIAAHKAVLAARSPVFLAMFKHDMKELKTNRVTVNDIDHNVFMEMLRFIYTDKAPNLEKMAKNLLTAADKYGLERLKAMCTVALYKSLSVENATDILVLSYLHNAKPLKDLAIKFICDQTKDFMETATFKSIASSYPDLMVDILCVLNTRRIGSKSVAAEEKSSVLRK